MNPEEQKHRLSLTLVFTGIVFCFLLTTMVIISVVIMLLIRANILSFGENTLNFRGFVLRLSLISVILGTALTALASRIPLRSVNTVINAINRLAAGDFRTRLSFSGRLSFLPVVRELTDSFNKMAAELENTELLRSDFVDNFSHEFKTPIVSIAGFAKLLKRGNLNEEEQHEYLDIIEDESLRLASMATNVLNMTRLESQEILTDISEFNLSEQLRHSVLLLENKWEKKNLELDLDFKEHMIQGNEELLKQVWVNLLDNAIKFTPEYGLIEITIDEKPSDVSVTITNVGSEISPDSQDRIFRKFYQGDESHAEEGNGIGLSIVKKVTELHKGTVSVSSGDGRTSFTVTLPKAI